MKKVLLLIVLIVGLNALKAQTVISYREATLVETGYEITGKAFFRTLR